MSKQDIVFGCIKIATPGARGGPEEVKLKKRLGNKIVAHNKSIISKLPVTDTYPPLSSKMFYFVPNKYYLSYRNPVIIFGGSFKYLCLDWPEWLVKFEGLLREIYWEQVTITLESSYLASETFRWSAKQEWIAKMCNRELEKIDDWHFEGKRILVEE